MLRVVSVVWIVLGLMLTTLVDALVARVWSLVWVPVVSVWCVVSGRVSIRCRYVGLCVRCWKDRQVRLCA